MNIPSEMRSQVAARTILFKDMQAAGVIATPIEYLEVPMMLVMNMTDDELDLRLGAFKRTRKRYCAFQLNGRMFVLSRCQSIGLVSVEKECRREHS